MLLGITTYLLIAGIRLIGGGTTDLQEAMSLQHMSDVIHIYSNSWGPPDSGDIVSGPGVLLQSVFETGVQEVLPQHALLDSCRGILY